MSLAQLRISNLTAQSAHYHKLWLPDRGCLGRVQQPWQTSAAARTHKLQPPLSRTPKASASTYTCHNLTDLLRKLTINIVSNLHYVHSLKGAQTLSVKSWNSVLYLDVSFNFGTNRCIMCLSTYTAVPIHISCILGSVLPLGAVMLKTRVAKVRNIF